jgi:hypothetical protein
MLEDLTPAPKVDAPNTWRPAVEFDGTTGQATTEGIEGQPDFEAFLLERGYDPKEYEVIGNSVRTSQWQVASPWPAEPRWLTSYRFHFRKRTDANPDLSLLYAEAKKTRARTPKATETGKVFIACLADYQVGKVDHRGGSKELIQRVLASYDCIEEQLKRGKYERIYALDLGDIIEGIENAANMNQLVTNDLSVMQQVDLAASLVWDFLKMATKYAPVTYASIGSNHCQWRVNKQTIGKPGRDDWGIVILQQLRRLSVEVGLPVTFLVPHEQEESLIFDAFGDGFHLVGIAHGHQFSRPENALTWWRQNTFGNQTISAASMLLTAHFHHLRVVEAGASHNGGSRFWIQATTSDNGSSWFKRISGEDSTPGITCLELFKGQHYQGAVLKL